mmetsp:Transcript_67286/g.186051  ORF Transcript_67286/g.186051 Transcript_67286/m.186051 type:complete len:317 (-) Transcript_67286:1277-2227(-)
MRGRIAQRAQRVHARQRLAAAAVDAAVHALRLVHDQDRPRLPHQVDGLLAACLLAGAVHHVLALLAAQRLVGLFGGSLLLVTELVDGTDRDHHDLNVRAGGEVANLPELGRVVLEELVTLGARIQGFEVLAGDLQRLVHALLDRDRRHHDHELGEAITTVQLEHRAQVHVGLAGACFHLHREVGRQLRGRRHAVAKLHAAQVAFDLVVQQRQPVADAPLFGGQHAFQRALGGGRVAASPGGAHRHCELGAADLLPTEQVTHRLDGGLLIRQVGLEVQSHAAASPARIGAIHPCFDNTFSAMPICRGVNCRLRSFQA